MRALVSGSLCYDYIFHCGGDDLREAGAGAVFFARRMRRAFGGCGANIAYGLAQLGDEPLLLAAAGRDFSDYRAHLAECGIADCYVDARDDCWTACAFIANDKNGAQMTIFHPGASANAPRKNAGGIFGGDAPRIAIVSPNGREAILRHIREFSAAGISFVFDPGQALGLLSGEEICEGLAACSCAIFNAGEFALAQKQSGGLTLRAAAEKAGALIITDGVRGARLHLRGDDDGNGNDNGGGEHCNAVVTGETVDPTGCGDAYRAGLLHGMLRNWKWRRTMQFAAAIAGIKARSDGGQQYRATAKETEALRKKFFG